SWAMRFTQDVESLEAGVASRVMVLVFFFFFQAEDGIRDFHVTGVQTCALPISSPKGLSATTSLGTWPQRSTRIRLPGSSSTGSRSEERRVGKEWRWRWARCTYKKERRRGESGV